MSRIVKGAGIFAAFAAACVGVIGATGFVLVMLFFNAIIGAILWPTIGNTVLLALHKPEYFVWWHGVLFSLVPYLGRWYVAIVLWVVVLIIF